MKFIKTILDYLFGEEKEIKKEIKSCSDCDNCLVGSYELNKESYTFDEPTCKEGMRIEKNIITGKEKLVGYTCSDMRVRGDWLYIMGCGRDAKLFKTKEK